MLVTHHVEEIMPVFSHALILRAGRRLTAGKVRTVLNSRQLSQAFDAPIRILKVKGRYTLAVAPKAGVVWTPADPLTVRASYTKSLGGVTLVQSYRVEPTQVAGFVQTYRTLFPISLTGPVSAQEFETAGAALEWKLPARTYLTLQFERVASQANNTRGVLTTDANNPAPFIGAG